MSQAAKLSWTIHSRGDRKRATDKFICISQHLRHHEPLAHYKFKVKLWIMCELCCFLTEWFIKRSHIGTRFIRWTWDKRSSSSFWAATDEVWLVHIASSTKVLSITPFNRNRTLPAKCVHRPAFDIRCGLFSKLGWVSSDAAALTLFAVFHTSID